jgi:protease-4
MLANSLGLPFMARVYPHVCARRASVTHINEPACRIPATATKTHDILLKCCLLLFVAHYIGCAQPLRVDARAQVDANGDINGNINGDIKAQLSPTPRLQPVIASSLPHGPQDPRAPAVAIVDVDGLLINTDATGLGSWGENPVSVFRERLDAIQCDPRICAIVIRINTLGGSVTATDIMWRDLTAFKKRTCLPVIACLMDVAAGGGYYLATAADSIVAHPTTVTGGIGCILNVYNLQDMMAQFNILGTPIKAGPNIDIGSPIKELSADKRKLLQDMADEFHSRFRSVVLRGRPNVDGKLDTTFDGRVFTARQAYELHLIDQIGYLDNAVAAARSMAGVNYVNLVFYHRRDDPALSQYSITPNTPLQKGIIPINVPGLDRSKLPCFLYLWQMEPSSEVVVGK